MIILASKPQIWPCFAMGSSVDGNGTARLRSLELSWLAKVYSVADILRGVTGGRLGVGGKKERDKGGIISSRWEGVEFGCWFTSFVRLVAG